MAHRSAREKRIDRTAIEPVLVDTSGLIALVSVKDAAHQEATVLARRLDAERCPLVATEWVLAEFLGSASRPPHRATAIRLVEHYQASPLTTVIGATSMDWHEGFELYKARPDKAWSLVDCISILVCQRLGIKEVFSGDKHFEQAGLKILLAGLP